VFKRILGPSLFANECLRSDGSSAEQDMSSKTPDEITGQLNSKERSIISDAILNHEPKPRAVLEVGTWLGGGSTLHILRALEQNGSGHLWGIEADRSIYDQMLANLRSAVPNALGRFTPLFGFSDEVIPTWLKKQPDNFQIDVAFLDGGNNPNEQIQEFLLIEPRMSVGAVLMSHDAKLRKGKWLVPFVSALDNWSSQLHDVSEEGLFAATKIGNRPSASSLRKAKAQLRRMRMQPAEIAAAILPAKVCAWILQKLPGRLSDRLSQGRN